MVVVYLRKKIERGGPNNGLNPFRVAKVERSLQLDVVYPEIEQILLNVQLTHPKGSYGIRNENDKKWKEVLNRFLVDEATMYSITGGRYKCSDGCLDEESGNYQFVDTARFALAYC